METLWIVKILLTWNSYANVVLEIKPATYPRFEPAASCEGPASKHQASAIACTRFGSVYSASPLISTFVMFAVVLASVDTRLVFLRSSAPISWLRKSGAPISYAFRRGRCDNDTLASPSKSCMDVMCQQETLRCCMKYCWNYEIDTVVPINIVYLCAN